MTDLLPCPFCGGDATLKHGYWIECSVCGAGINAPVKDISKRGVTALWNARHVRDPAQPSGAREALDKLADKVSAKINQLEHYRDNDCQLDHARTIAEGRISQANQILHWIAEAAVSHEPAAPAEAAGEAVALAHITLEDDGPYATLEILNGELLQPSMSPVKLYAKPPHSGQKGDAEYQELARELLQASDEYDRGHGPLHALAANAILYLLSRPQSPAEVAETEDQAHIRTALETLCDPALIQVGGVGITRLMALVNRMAGIAKTALQRLPASPTQSGGAGNG